MDKRDALRREMADDLIREFTERLEWLGVFAYRDEGTPGQIVITVRVPTEADPDARPIVVG